MSRIRVLESFPPPRSTTNPYIIQLSRALSADTGIDMHHFSWREALTGDYDVFHVHWPDALLDGRSPLRRAGKRAAAALLLARLRARRIPIVRTVHNPEPHELTRSAAWIDAGVERRTVARIQLNDTVPAEAPDVLIPHGDYRDWFAQYPHDAITAGRIAFVGLIRPYKGVEQLIDAFATLAAHDENVSLMIAGKPRTEVLHAELEHQLSGLPRAIARFEYVSDADLVRVVTSSQIVVLPYHRMTNSGAAVAALSLDRPVLVPDGPTARSLQSEVGAEWVLTFEPPLDAPRLADALDATARRDPAGRVHFVGRDWAGAGARHRAAFERVVRQRP